MSASQKKLNSGLVASLPSLLLLTGAASVSTVASAIIKNQKTNHGGNAKHLKNDNATSSSSPVPSSSSVSNKEIVTVNGGHGTKNSSIIYLSPDRSTPPRSSSATVDEEEKRSEGQNVEGLITIQRQEKGAQIKKVNSNKCKQTIV